MNKFDSIRPYNDGEVSSVLKSLCEDNDFLNTVALMQQFKHLQYLPFSKKILSLLLKNKIKGINSIKGYQSYIEQILKSFIEICSKKRGELKAELKSAKRLSSDEISKINEELSQNFSSKIKLNYKHDESLIGGLVVQVGSIMVDTSIKNKLQQIENRMIEA